MVLKTTGLITKKCQSSKKQSRAQDIVRTFLDVENDVNYLSESVSILDEEDGQLF